jgi:hypothetical protein
VIGMPFHGQERLERWLTGRHRDLRDGLDQFLDPDAGLREATMLDAEHTTLLGTLDSHLDTRAGLAAILPSSAAAPLTPPSPPATPAAIAIATADPAARMALRRHPIILAAILSDLTVRALTIANETSAARDIARARDIALALARDHARDRDHALARALALNLARARDHALARALALNLARALALDLDRALALALDRALARDRALDRALALDLDRALDLARNLAFARDTAHQTALVVGRALGIGQVEGLAAALLDGALDDFTHADLARADFTGRDLTGVRWSDSGTTWPPGTDVERLRARSREVGHGTGIYVIASPGDSDKAFQYSPG